MPMCIFKHLKSVKKYYLQFGVVSQEEPSNYNVSKQNGREDALKVQNNDKKPIILNRNF